MTDTIAIGRRSVTIGYRAGVALVVALVTGSVGGTSIVLHELHQIETQIRDLSGLPARVDELDRRADVDHAQIVRLTESADVGWPAWPR